MPGGDRKGPMGEGPLTGRQRGYCAGYERPGVDNPEPGYGRGLGRGYGRGLARGYGRGSGRGYGLGLRNRFRDYGDYRRDVPEESGVIQSIKDAVSSLEEKVRRLERKE